MRRRRFSAASAVLLSTVTVLALVTPALPASAAPPPAPAPAAEDRGRSAEALAQRADRDGPMLVLLEVDSTRNGPAVAAEGRRNGGVRARSFDHLPYVAMRATGQAIRALGRNPHVVSITEDVPEPPSLASTLQVINADDTQALGWTGAGRTVAILDTGIDADHAFFNDNNAGGGSRILSQACFSDPDGGSDPQRLSLCPNGTSTDLGSADVDGHAQCTAAVSSCDHGTHVAGIAAGDGTGVTGAPGSGVAPDAGIIAIQVFTRFNSATDCDTVPAPCLLTTRGDQVAGLNRVAALNTANPGWNITAVNMSLGGGSNATACDGDPRKTAIDTLLAAGIATVIAAGNASMLNAVGAPGCISTAVTVGNTNDNDTVRADSNRGPLLDIFAPGGGVDSAVPDDAWGSMSGTSMSAPHVAGAFAALREAYPARTVADLLNDMTSTGVPITYATDTATPPAQSTTPRLNLLAALQAFNAPPALGVSSTSVSVTEGAVATNSGSLTDPENNPITALTASVGTVTRSGSTWSWSLRPQDGPAVSTVTISATDDKGETGTTSFTLNVLNVSPAVAIAPGQVTSLSENGTVSVTATFSDPGVLDAPTAAIDWGVPAGHAGQLVSGPTVTVTDPGGPGAPLRGTVTGTYRYGDNSGSSAFPVTVTVTDKDGGAGSAGVGVRVTNTAPSTAIDEGSGVLLNGVPTLVAHAGQSVTLGAGATDPGSDDLSLAWDFADGTPVVTHTDLVNGPASDPLPSPTVQARSVLDSVSHAFGSACLYTVGLRVTDDDNGSVADTIPVIIAGNATLARSSGYWSAEYRAKRSTDFTPQTLTCYLAIVRHISAVFPELRALSTNAHAADVLKNSGTGSAEDIFDAQLLAAWLNFANGVYDLDELVDTNGDGTADTTFLAVLTGAEAVRTDPARTRDALLAKKNVLERLNNP